MMWLLSRAMTSFFVVMFLAAAASLLAAAQSTPSYGAQDCLYENCLPSQSGYLDGYNFDPAVVGSASFGQLWNTVVGDDYFLAQPVTYTPSGGSQVVIAMSEANKIFVLDAATGAIKAQRNVGVAFSNTDANCNDINPTIGITSTPVIDASTGTLYFWSKTYVSGTTSGFANARYRFYGVDALTLQDRFTPFDPQGLVPANNAAQHGFTAGEQLQRVGLVLINGVVYGAFGGHCDNFNYTGWIIGIDAASGTLANSFSTQAGPKAGIGSGIWQAGGALTWDGRNIYFCTGNGFGEELVAPRLGSQPPGALAMAVTRLSVDPVSRNLTATDFFVPSDYRAIDAADQDFGSSGVALLSTGFAKGSVRRLLIANGKNSKAYVMNADNLGGYKTGPNGGDGNLQTIPLSGQSFSTAGAYPFEGGYIYISAVGSPTVAYQLGADANGSPIFTQVGQTADAAQSVRGTGHSTVTSNGGRAGTGLLWVTDVQNGNLRVYPAVPPSSGSWNHIFIATLPRGGVKYGRVTPGSGKMFVTSVAGTVTAFGSPVNQPFNCTTGLDFGQTTIGTKSTVSIKCTPLIGTKISSFTVSNTTVTLQNLPAISTSYTASSPAFTFNATWTPNAAGSFLFAVTVSTQNAQAGYVTSLPVGITGKAVSAAAQLDQSPSNLAFGGVTPGSSLTVGGLNKTITLTNRGLQPLTVKSWDFDEFYDFGENGGNDDDDGDSTLHDTDGTNDDKTTTGNFTLYGMPSTVPALSSVSLTINYNPTVFGDYNAKLNITTNGGQGITIITGTAASAGELHLLTQQASGAYLVDTDYMDFGVLSAGVQKVQSLIVNNTGGSALQLTKSKPPIGSVIRAQNGDADLTEGQYVPPMNSSSALIIAGVLLSQVNVPGYNVSAQWVLNANGDKPGVHFVQMSARIVSMQVGPLLSVSDPYDVNGTARYQYLGCYSEMVGTRSFATNPGLSTANMTNAACLTAASTTSGVANFAATEYGQECWFRSEKPSTSLVDDTNCLMPCTGDATQSCGAAGYMSVFYDSTTYNKTSGTFLPNAYLGPTEVPYTGNWTSLSCVTEGNGIRALTGATMTTDTMSVESCTAYCQTTQSTYAGVEYGGECYCGNSLSQGVTFNATGCTMPCSGNRNELCGAGNLLNLYIYNQTYSSGTGSAGSPPPSTTTFPPNYKGCFAEPSDHRALSIAMTVSNNTVERCQSACYAANYTVAGVEYGSECYCDTAFNTGTTSAPDTDCSTACPGNSTEFCGAGNRLSVYSATLANITTRVPPTLAAQVGMYSLYGCVSDSTASRTLTGDTPNLGSKNSLEACAAACSAYTYFGTEYATECYCGNTLSSNAVNKSLSDCSMACPGNASESCGAGNRLSLYALTVLPISSSSSSSTSSTSTDTSMVTSTASSTSTSTSTSTTSTSTSTTSTSTSATSTSSSLTSTSSSTSTASTATSSSTSSTVTPPPSSTSKTITTSSTSTSASTSLPTGFSRLPGCYYDDQTDRTLTLQAYSSSSNTPSFCATQCRNLGFKYAGVEYGSECYCGNFILYSGSAANGNAAPAMDCAANACSGDETQTCGGSLRLQIYQDTQWQQRVFTVQQYDRWNFTDCLTDKTYMRTLDVALAGGAANRVEMCLDSCFARNLTYCGVEYGGECYGGQQANVTTLSAPNVGFADPLARGCNTPCNGNATQACGGPNRLDVYTYLPNQASSVKPATVQTSS